MSLIEKYYGLPKNIRWIVCWPLSFVIAVLLSQIAISIVTFWIDLDSRNNWDFILDIMDPPLFQAFFLYCTFITVPQSQFTVLKVIIGLRTMVLIAMLVGNTFGMLGIANISTHDAVHWEAITGEIVTLAVSILLYKRLKKNHAAANIKALHSSTPPSEISPSQNCEYSPSHACPYVVGKQLRDVIEYNSRGSSYIQRGEYDYAISEFTKATEIAPGHAKSHYNLGYTYLLKGDKDRALREHAMLETLDEELAKKLIAIIEEQ